MSTQSPPKTVAQALEHQHHGEHDRQHEEHRQCPPWAVGEETQQQAREVGPHTASQVCLLTTMRHIVSPRMTSSPFRSRTRTTAHRCEAGGVPPASSPAAIRCACHSSHGTARPRANTNGCPPENGRRGNITRTGIHSHRRATQPTTSRACCESGRRGHAEREICSQFARSSVNTRASSALRCGERDR